MVNKYTVDHGAIHKDWPPGRMEMVTAADYGEVLRILARVRAALATTPYWRSLREEVESVLTPVDGGSEHG